MINLRMMMIILATATTILVMMTKMIKMLVYCCARAGKLRQQLFKVTSDLFIGEVGG
jgi:hypothetical protein